MEVEKIGRGPRHGTARRVLHYSAIPFGVTLFHIHTRDPPSLVGWVHNRRAADRSVFGLLSSWDRSSWRSPVSQKTKSATLHNARKSTECGIFGYDIHLGYGYDRSRAVVRLLPVIHAQDIRSSAGTDLVDRLCRIAALSRHCLHDPATRYTRISEAPLAFPPLGACSTTLEPVPTVLSRRFARMGRKVVIKLDLRGAGAVSLGSARLTEWYQRFDNI